MKKPIACLLVALMATTTVQVFAQNMARAEKKEVRKENDKHAGTARKAMSKLRGTEVSKLSKDAFSSDFGEVGNITWMHHDQFDEANFMNKGVKTTAFYGFDDRLIGSTSAKKYSDLPAGARKEIDKDYKDKGYTIGAVIMYDDNESNGSDMILYGEQFEGADHYFVEVGKVGKQTVLMVNPEMGEVSYFTDLR